MNHSTLTARVDRLTAPGVSQRPGPALLAVTTAALTGGDIAWLVGAPGLADLLWALGTGAAVVPAVRWVLAAPRRGRAGVDLIAVLALGGTPAVGEYLAGVLIALMLATGRTLESVAQRRASHDLRALLEHAPRSARVRTGAGIATVPLGQVVLGDMLVVRSGEVVPVDGRVKSAAAVLDESVLTGEPVPVMRLQGEGVRSGVVNAGGAFELRAIATERESTYAQIVRLARKAGVESAPVVRLACSAMPCLVRVTRAFAIAPEDRSITRLILVAVNASPGWAWRWSMTIYRSPPGASRFFPPGSVITSAGTDTHPTYTPVLRGTLRLA
ncbi:hypothetical protein KQY30_05700 [Streptomyces sp. GMY02]|nr:hypothetical protein KQY30_05700 [Streptomyces sp. GMY02]